METLQTIKTHTGSLMAKAMRWTTSKWCIASHYLDLRTHTEGGPHLNEFRTSKRLVSEMYRVGTENF